MTAFDPNPSIRWLFCVTHPDDEVFVGGWIRRLAQAGAHVAVGFSHHTEARAEEARQAAAHLGVDPASLRFFGSPDGGVLEDLDRLIPMLEAWLLDERPDRVVTTAYEQGHLDHDATHYAIRHVWHGPLFEFPLYHGYDRRIMPLGRFAEAQGAESIRLGGNEVQAKLQTLAVYRSQSLPRIVRILRAWESFRGVQPLVFDAEYLRLCPTRDYLRPNVPSWLLPRIERSAKWRIWVQAIKRRQPERAPGDRG